MTNEARTLPCPEYPGRDSFTIRDDFGANFDERLRDPFPRVILLKNGL